MAARSAFRSYSLLMAARARCTSATRSSRPSFRLPKPAKPAAHSRILRCPVEMSFCLESMMPMHSATATALMKSMLAVPSRGYGWILEAGNDGV